MFDVVVTNIINYFINLDAWVALNSLLIGIILVIFSIAFGRAIKTISSNADMTFKVWFFKRRVNPGYLLGEVVFRIGSGLILYSVMIVVFLLLKLLFPF